METNFGATPPYTVGVEEEFQLIDPASGELSPSVDRVLSGVGAGEPVTSELSSSCVELVSPVFGSVAELSGELPVLRRRIGELAGNCGLQIAASGTHPFSNPLEQPFTEGEHYSEIEERMGWVARTQTIYGLHVHVGVADREESIRAVDTLVSHVPLLLALSANSPFWRGTDTRLSSARIKVFEVFPRSGLPPDFGCWRDFERHVEALVAAGSIPDYTWCWWDVRPHPGLGTVELRALDVQTDPASTAALAALVQCLVASSPPMGSRGDHGPDRRFFVDENKWRAARYGLSAMFYDFSTGEEVGAREMAVGLVGELRTVARDLGCEKELKGVLEICRTGTGADHQRAALAERGSLRGVVEYLTGATVPGRL